MCSATTNNDQLWNGNLHITQEADTYYIAGDNENTASTYTFNWNELSDDTYDMTLVTSGDGTVLSYSAAMNDLYESKTYFATVNHVGLVKSSNVINFVESIINGNVILTSGIYKDPLNPM